MFTDTRTFVFSNALVKVSDCIIIFVEELSWYVSRMAHMTKTARVYERERAFNKDEILFRILWRMEVTLLLDSFHVICPKLL